jgi:hypothetical protein
MRELHMVKELLEGNYYGRIVVEIYYRETTAWK